MKTLLSMVTMFIFSLVMISGCETTTGRTAGEIVDDSVIKTEINSKIIKDPDLHLFKINVDSYEGNVTLSGRVPNKQDEDRLITLAKETRGVRSVTSNLTTEATTEGKWEGTKDTTMESTGTTNTM